jgi:hypothetical protein
MKTKLLAVLLLAGSSIFASPRVVFGVGIGVGGYYPAPVVSYAPPPPAPAAYAVPVAPGPGLSWIGGYWYPVGPRWAWHGGYWARRPYAGAYWVGPRYYAHRYYPGYWHRR